MKRLCGLVLVVLTVAGSTVARGQATGGTVIVTGGGGASRVTKGAKRPQGFSSEPPPLLLKAKTVFVSNAGSDAGLFPHPFTGTQDRAYGYFCDKIDDNDHFSRVNVPADADLVLEVSMNAPPGSVAGNKSKGTGDALPTFKIVAYDRASHYILWVVSQTVDEANLQKTHDRNFDAAIDSAFTQFMAAATGTPIPPPPPPPKVTVDTP